MNTHAMRLLAALSITLCASPTLANDSAFGGSGADLRPLVETRVQMQSEDIVLDLKRDPRVKDNAWHITASYRFHNPTTEAVALQVGFPEQTCGDGEECMGEGGRFRDLAITVRGKPVTHRTGTVAKKDAWGDRLGQVYLFDVRFEAGETVEVVHRYTYDRSAGVEGEWLEYLTTTGALWNGPIGHARFTVRVPERPWLVSYLPAFEMTRFSEKRITPQRAVTEMVFEARAWTPKRDFMVTLSHAHNAAGYFPKAAKACPGFHAFEWSHREDAADALKTTSAAFARLDRKTLRVCRNLPYARHGYPFKSDDLRSMYYGPGARKGYGVPFFPRPTPSGDDPYEKQPWTYTTFAPNPDYTPDLLTPLEVEWVRLIKAAEAR